MWNDCLDIATVIAFSIALVGTGVFVFICACFIWAVTLDILVIVTRKIRKFIKEFWARVIQNDLE